MTADLDREHPQGPQFVRDSYEQRWSLVEDKLRTLISRGESDLSRILHLLQTGAKHGKKSIASVLGYPSELADMLSYPAEQPPLAIQRFARSAIVDTVIERSERVDAIIELGAGWGSNLFHIWARGGPDVEYHCLDFADSGLQVCDLITRTIKRGPRIRGQQFDFRAPDFDYLTDRYRSVLVLTSSAIDKVTWLPDAFLDQVARLAPDVEVISFEFVGWQDQQWSQLPQQLRNQIEEGGVNRDYLPLIRSYEHRDRLRLKDFRTRAFGRNESLIIWGN